MGESGARHRLVEVIAGRDGSGEFEDVDLRVPIEELWAAAARISGLGEWELAKSGAEHLGEEIADLDDLEPAALSLVPEKLARNHCVLPLREDDRELIVATADPMDLRAEEDLRFASGREPVFQVAPPGLIRQAIDTNYQPDDAVENLLASVDAGNEAIHLVGGSAPELDESDASTEPVVKLTNLILREAVDAGASDVHLAPGRGLGTVQYRVDGVLQLHMRVPMPVFHRLVSRIKVMADMDIADRLRPKDGRARVRVQDNVFDLRISTVPTRSAEKAVIRVLYTDEAPDLDELGMADRELERLRRMLSNRDSIVFVTGPTGSGKTTTLYAALRELDTGDVNIMTVEDPVEYELGGITQIQVKPEQDVTFASALRAILRQDPDIILVGEIRDLETAEIAVQAAQTGHLVLATLHTNDALGVVPRLVDLGLPRRSIAESLCGMVAQRLVRIACSECARPIEEDAELEAEEERLAGNYEVRPRVRPEGCDHCHDLGYKGRRPVLETVLPTQELTEQISVDASPSALRKTALEAGMRPLQEAALDLVREGVTTLQEVDRALGEASEPDDRRRGTGRTSPTEPPSGSVGASGEQPDEAPTVSGPEAATPAEAGSDADAEVADRAEAQAKDDADADPEGGVGSEADDELGTPHVLMVDDDPVILKMAEGVLEENGFRFSSAEDGVEALDLLNRGGDFDLMILDLGLPKLEGDDVLRLARSSSQTAALPIVVLTGADSSEREVEIFESGADDYLQKPLEPARFLARIRAVLRRTDG